MSQELEADTPELQRLYLEAGWVSAKIIDLTGAVKPSVEWFAGDPRNITREKLEELKRYYAAKYALGPEFFKCPYL